jgi:hypothetical protein
MISDLELRHIVESGFLPVKCICSISPTRVMTIQLIDPDTHEIGMTVPGIPVSDLTSIRFISDLIAQIREEYQLSRMVQGGYRNISKHRESEG